MIKNSIVLVPFPFDDFSSVKVRPVVCLTSEIGRYKHVVVAFISSNISNYNENLDILIKKDSDLNKNTGLLVNSVIKIHRITTIPKHLIKRRLGTITPKLSNKIYSNLAQLFEIDKYLNNET